jgi:hypothetical protein
MHRMEMTPLMVIESLLKRVTGSRSILTRNTLKNQSIKVKTRVNRCS